MKFPLAWWASWASFCKSTTWSIKSTRIESFLKIWHRDPWCGGSIPGFDSGIRGLNPWAGSSPARIPLFFGAFSIKQCKWLMHLFIFRGKIGPQFGKNRAAENKKISAVRRVLSKFSAPPKRFLAEKICGPNRFQRWILRPWRAAESSAGIGLGRRFPYIKGTFGGLLEGVLHFI